MKYLILLILLSGCALNETKETLVFYIPSQKPQLRVEYESRVTQGLLLYFTKSKQIEHTSPFSTLCVGGHVTEPNSVEAIVPLLEIIKLIK